MSTTTLNTKFQLRRDFESTWTTTNPVLADGEPVLSKVEGVYKLKIGDGVTPFSNLPYIGGGGSGDADWVTLLNKPFYEKQIAEKVYTADFTGTADVIMQQPNFDINFYKISSNIYSLEELQSLKYTFEIIYNNEDSELSGTNINGSDLNII